MVLLAPLARLSTEGRQKGPILALPTRTVLRKAVMRTPCLLRSSSKNNRVLVSELETSNTRVMMLELEMLMGTKVMHGIQTIMQIMVWIRIAI